MMFLTQDEIEELTGYKKRPSQVHTLCLMGIEHKVRSDGKVLVLKSHIEQIFTGQKPNKPEKVITPNFGALRA